MEVVKLPVNKINQQPMKAYMKNRFTFLGLSAPIRKVLTKEIIKESKSVSVPEVLSIIDDYYKLQEREYQYVAIDIALANYKRFSYEEIIELSCYVSEKAWWDSVDAWRKFFGLRVANYPKELEGIFCHFHEQDDFWMRRVAINLQLLFKEKTDTALLERAIIKDLLTDEFFVQKAIGWSLRQYSKTNQKWVEDFLETHELSSLAVREASKHFSES